MGLPRPVEARLYYRAAKQRHDDALLLLEAERTTGAVYLAGYTVECFLKALVLAGVAPGLRREILGEFRGSRAHDIEWLGALYRRHVAVAVPRDVTRHLSRVASWSTDLRYATGLMKRRDADEFMESVVAVATWADGRM
jgi:HEPN domain-containing protein